MDQKTEALFFLLSSGDRPKQIIMNGIKGRCQTAGWLHGIIFHNPERSSALIKGSQAIKGEERPLRAQDNDPE